MSSNLSVALAQKYSLQFTSNDNNTSVKKYFKTSYKDSLSIYKDIAAFKNEMISKSYLLASVDSVVFDSTNVKVYFYKGNKYVWKDFSFTGIDDYVKRKLNLNKKKTRNKPLNITKLNSNIENLLEYYENNGYPFAEISMNNVNIDDDGVSANLEIKKNDLIRIDSIVIKGNANISKYYINKHIGIEPGDLYNDKKIRLIENKINELPFLKQIRNYELGFKNKKSKIYLYLDNKRANRFNGIVGVVPADKTTGKLLLTGELRLFLINSFKNGESISFNWKKLESTSQNLDVRFSYPFLFKKPVGTDITFSLLKQDTLYVNVNSNAGILFMIDATNFIKGYIENKSSSLLSTAGFEHITVLPAFADVKTTLYGTGIFFENLDYKYNPRKGVSVLVNIGAGTKHIKKNDKINPDVYKDMEMNTRQIEGRADLSLYFPVSVRNIIKIRNISGFMSSSTLFENELFRIGGLRTIRGFDEESIYASSYSVLSVEFRFLLEKNSSLYAFCDGGFYEQKLNDYLSDTPYGFGAGIDFDTKAGIFTVSYAVGKQFNNPIDLKSAKIHFGFANRF